ncbi:MAG: tRNA pseudouridine(38-40) synthase TruA [Desulfovibrio sp.]|nr:tRNA pseudouridine(38-40) synthase TruA [Desulfovibrio sp.]
MRYKLVLAYLGTNYHGWQVQLGPPGQTIQGCLEEVFLRLTSHKVAVIASGRTDAGVHALAQVCHVDLAEPMKLNNLARSLNALLPEDIRVLKAEPCAENFHARYSALSKTYLYRFWPEMNFLPPQLAPYVWQIGPLNQAAMQKALPYLQGTHDFASFQNKGTAVTSTVRTIFELSLSEEEPNPYWPPYTPSLVLKVTASGFLKQMVRNLAGLLALLGRGQLEVSKVQDIIKQAQRKHNPCPTAPAKGLTLALVNY